MKRIGTDGWIASLSDAPLRLPPEARAHGQVICRAEVPGGGVGCTRPLGHGGRHRADGTRVTFAVWR